MQEIICHIKHFDK